MNLIIKAIMAPITGKNDDDDDDVNEDEILVNEGEVEESDNEDGSDDEGDDDEDEQADAADKSDRDDIEDIEMAEEDQRLDDDEINPGLDTEDAQFLNGLDFRNLVNGFIAERKFTFLQPNANDLKDMRQAVKLVRLFVPSNCCIADMFY
jgi:hypothetical protein